MHDDHRATRRLITYIEKRVMVKETFARIAADVGLSEWTIRSIFDEFAAREQKTYHREKGLSIRQIARSASLSRSTVQDHLARGNWPDFPGHCPMA
jgi:DNA-binding NarL/FixJ family response regulator